MTPKILVEELEEFLRFHHKVKDCAKVNGEPYTLGVVTKDDEVLFVKVETE